MNVIVEKLSDKIERFLSLIAFVAIAETITEMQEVAEKMEQINSVVHLLWEKMLLVPYLGVFLAKGRIKFLRTYFISPYLQVMKRIIINLIILFLF